MEVEGHCFQLEVLGYEGLYNEKYTQRENPGIPSYAGLILMTTMGAQLKVHPTPSADGVLRVFYYPPRMEA